MSTPSPAASIHPQAFVHPHALVDAGASLGARTRVWAFAHILPGATVGEDCNVCDHSYVEGKVTVGHRVTIKSGVFLWDGVVVEDDCHLGPNATFTNDLYPRSRKFLPTYPITRLRRGCSIGGNSTVTPGVTVGRWALVGAGAVVTRDVPDFALVMGNPARFRSWICSCGKKLPTPAAKATPFPCECGLRYELVAERELRCLDEQTPGKK